MFIFTLVSCSNICVICCHIFTVCLFSIARADDTDEDEFSSSGRQITEACDCTVDGDDTTFLNKSKEMIKM